MTHQVERGYTVFLWLIQVQINNNFRRMCKILPSDIFKNLKWPPKLHEISILTITSEVLVVELQFLVLFCGYDHAE